MLDRILAFAGWLMAAIARLWPLGIALAAAGLVGVILWQERQASRQRGKGRGDG